MSRLVDQYGKPLSSEVDQLRRTIIQLRMKQSMRAKYDAAQTFLGNERHWSNADNLDPNSANSLPIRRKLRSRSRYEVIENNPYLKGVLLSLANDFVGTGPRLQIVDRKLSKEQRAVIKEDFSDWAEQVKLRKKLWRLQLAKRVDGESFAIARTNPRLDGPVYLDFQIVECDQISSDGILAIAPKPNEVDGVRFDNLGNATEYFLLNYHPGGILLWGTTSDKDRGEWIDARLVIHWFRQDRGWLRGIPELTPSIPLCALLRRYTMAVCRHAETAADFSAIVETEGPPSSNAWTDGEGNLVSDDPFDTFPINLGMITNLPWGYKMKQLNPVPNGVNYDEYVGALLREITRPLLVPFNIAAGTSKDSNMATSVVDTHIYQSGIDHERMDGEDEVLERMLRLWWSEYVVAKTVQRADFVAVNRLRPPAHYWKWDRVGLEHTDPEKVANALKIMHDKGFLTDKDIQESRFNRDIEDWQEEISDQMKFRASIKLPTNDKAADKAPGERKGNNEKAKPKSAKAAYKRNGKPSRNGSRIHR